MRMKKFLTFLLTLAMVVSMLPAAAFAANNTATTMRLAKTQGTVAVTNATGKKVPQTGNMKLYNGYKIKTGAKSYAWISLDDTKAAKLDANSVVSVQKSGQKLTLYLSSGNLFFHVKEKLSGGESFHIKTSTMTTGIRGTSGCVRIINPRVTEIHLLTGQIEVYTENPELHISKTAVLKAGQKATSLIAEDAMAATGEQADIIIEKLTHDEVCGNCSKEIAADPELVERIKEEAPHLLPEKIADEADERLEIDEEAAEEKQAAIEKAVDEQTLPEDVDPYFEKEEAGGGSGGGGGSSAPVNPSTTVQVSTWGELVQAIIDYNGGSGTTEIRLMGDIDGSAETTTLPTVEAQNALTLNLRTHTLTLNDTLINESDLTITSADGYLIGPGDYMKETVNNKSGATLTLMDGQIDGNDQTAVVNEGTFYMKGGELLSGNSYYTATTLCALENTAGAVAYISGGTLMSETGINAITTGVENKGTVTISGNAVFEDLTIAISTLGDVTMTGGTMHVAEGTGISALGGVITLKGGEILVDDANGIGVDVYAYDDADPAEVILDGTEIKVTDGLGMLLGVGNIRLRSGMISADVQNSSTAVAADTGFTQSMILESINATIRAKDTDEVFVIGAGNDLPEGYTLKNDTANSGYYILTEGAAITTWAELVDAVEDFNALDGSGQTVTLTLGADIPAATETNPETMASIASGNKHLVIDLNNHDLTLPQTITVDGNLELVGGGVITGTGTKLFEVPSTGSIEMNSNTSGAPTIALKQGQIAINSTQSSVYMNAGQILLNETRITGIYSTDGYVYMTGGEIVLVKYEDGWANIGIQAMSGAEVTMSGGTIREDDGIKDVETALDDNYAIYASGSTVALTGGTVSVHNGTAIGVTDPSQLTLGSAVVTGKDAAKLLVTDNDDETGFITSVYNAPYFQLQNDVPGINTWTEFETAVAAFNAGTINTIELTGNVDPTPTEAAAAEAAGSLVIGDTSAATLTIDLNGYTLALPTLLETGSGLDLVIDGSGGQIIVDDDWNAGFLMGGAMIENYADLTLKNGTMVVSDGLTGVMIGSNVLTLGDNSTLRVDNGTGVDNDTGSMSMSSSASIIVNSGTGVINFNNPFTMNGGTITADGTGSTGVNAVRTDLVSGEITATDGAAAVSSSQEPLALGNGMIVRADDSTKVYVVTGGGTLVNYESVDGGDGYYYLKAIN